MFVLGLTLVFGLTGIDAPPGEVDESLGVDESLDVAPPAPGSVVCAAAGPMPTMSAASDAAAIVAYFCFIVVTLPSRFEMNGANARPPFDEVAGAMKLQARC